MSTTQTQLHDRYFEVFPGAWFYRGVMEDHEKYAPAFVVHDNIMFVPSLETSQRNEAISIASGVGLTPTQIDWSLYRDAWINVLHTNPDLSDAAVLFVKELATITLQGRDRSYEP